MAGIAQKVCMIEGVTHLISITHADLAVILHSEPDCANLVLSDSRAADPRRFFCTNLEERDVLGGTSAARLEEAIRWVSGNATPPLILVVGSCTASILADDIEAVCEKVAADVSPALVTLPMHAFRLYEQVHIVDAMTHLLATAAAPGAPRSEPTVNLLGYPGVLHEATELLSALGIEVNASPWFGPNAGSWDELGNASLNVVSDIRLFRRLVDSMELPHLELPPPCGLAATDRFIEGVAAHFDREVTHPGIRKDAVRSIEDAREALDGRRIACHIGGRKDFELETLVRDGLYVVDPLREMGLTVELLFQGAGEKEALDRIAAVLEAHGMDAAFHTVRDRVSLTEVLLEHRYDAVHCSDSLHEEVRAASIPLVPTGSLLPGYAGVASNATRLLDALGGGP